MRNPFEKESNDVPRDHDVYNLAMSKDISRSCMILMRYLEVTVPETQWTLRPVVIDFSILIGGLVPSVP